MLKLFMIGFIIFVIFIFAMAIGIIFGQRPLRGSCGGLGKIIGKDCSICKERNKCGEYTRIETRNSR